MNHQLSIEINKGQFLSIYKILMIKIHLLFLLIIFPFYYLLIYIKLIKYFFIIIIS